MAALPVDNADTFQRWLLEEFNDNGETVMFRSRRADVRDARQGSQRGPAWPTFSKREKIERAMDILKKAIEVYNAK